MKPARKHLLPALNLLLVMITLMGCIITSNPASTLTPLSGTIPPTEEMTQAIGQTTPRTGTETVEPDPLDRLLTMRSVKIDLTVLHPDGTTRSISVEIDSAGNMRVNYSRPAMDLIMLPEGTDLTGLPTSYEMYIVDGDAYMPSDLDPAWMTTPTGNDYVTTLSGQMHDLDGFTTWLDILPEGSLQSAGTDTVGGMEAEKYTVNGDVDGQMITGALWFEPQADALVQAELQVPALLFSGPDTTEKGEYVFNLTTRLADVTPVTLPTAPVDVAGATATPAAGSSSTGSGSLEISDSYPFFNTKLTIGSSLTASPGKVWIGTITGTIEEVGSQSGAFGQSITLPGGGSMTSLYPVMKLRFEGQYLWAWANRNEGGAAHPFLFAIDAASGTVVHQWDLDSTEWTRNRERLFGIEDFGVSPGRIWIDSHVIDAQTFEVTPDIYMPGMTLFAYNGNGWMWMSGDNGGECDDLVLVNADDPMTVWCPSHWPFVIDLHTGEHAVGPGSSMVLAGDQMWVSGGWSGTTPTYNLEAYWADMDQAMQETGPLASVPLLDSYLKVRLLYAGNSLWAVYTGGEMAGFLYQLNPQTGATINSLDLVGDQGRSISDVPMDIATEGDNLWILTSRQLLRVKLP